MTNARAKREKASVFTGPIFNETEDFEWDLGREDMRGFKAPREYWKLAAGTALIADQAPLIDFLPSRAAKKSAKNAKKTKKVGKPG